MPDEHTLSAWLRLESVPGLGPASLHELLATFGDVETILAAHPQQLAPRVGERLAQAIARSASDPNSQALIDTTLAWLEQPGNHFLPCTSPHYPCQLRDLPDAPPWLYVKGDPAWLQRPLLAVVGSRHATPQGMRDASAFAHALSEAGLTIVSGLALGIDTAAHEGGLSGLGSSVAVVGTGLDRVYPARNRNLAHRLAGQGAIVSEFPLGTPPKAGHFPRRNRLISGLSSGVLVIEAALESGSLITARLAAEQGRDVFALPGSIHSPLSKGCHRLIREGAKLVDCAHDVLEELAVHLSAASWPTTTGHAPSEETPPDAVLDALSVTPLTMDQLAERLGLTVDALSVRLLSAEMAGQIARLPGGLYQRIH